MLSSSASKWPVGGDWALQPKFDGFRLLVEIPHAGAARAWSRHGASLSEQVPQILEPFCAMPPGTIVDGELVALAELDGCPVQDFAAVRRAVFNGDTEAASRLRFVAFDLLSVGATDLRSRPWAERDERVTRVGCRLRGRPYR